VDITGTGRAMRHHYDSKGKYAVKEGSQLKSLNLCDASVDRGMVHD
jgi:hypothetical protein